MNDIDLLTVARPHVDNLDRADKQRLYIAITSHTTTGFADPRVEQSTELIPIAGHDRRRATFRHFAIARAAALVVGGIVGVAGVVALARNTPVPTDPAGSPSAAPTVLSTTTVPTAALQDQILADGVVTDTELTAAQNATVACIEAGGFNAYYGGPDGHQLVSSAPEAKTDQLNAVVDTCEASNSTRASIRYAYGHLPSDFHLETIWACMRDEGLVAASDTDPTTAFQQAVSINESAADACIKLGKPD